MKILVLNGVDVKTPDKYSLLYTDIDSEATKMSEAATLMRKRIRSRRAKITCSWESLTETELHKIMEATVDESFIVSYFNGKTTMESEKMYIGDINIDLANADGATTNKRRWKLSCSFIAY